MQGSPSPHQGPPSARVLHLKQFEEASTLFANWRGQFEQISNGQFVGAFRFVRGGILRLVSLEANQRVLLRGRDVAGWFSVYPVTARNAASLWQGHRLSPGQLVVHGTNAETNHCSARQTDNLGVSLPPKLLEEAARLLLNSEVTLPPSWETLTPPPEAFDTLNRRLSGLLQLGVADPLLLGTPEGDRLEQECVRSLVASLFSTATPQPALCLAARCRLIRRAEEFMRSRLSEPLGAIDLCRELGTSDRTLRLAFRERFGLGPMAFYKCLRLNAVRSQLRANSHLAIADVAFEFGFHHLGNFAADYRRLFGHRPSESPRQPPDSSTTSANDNTPS